MKINWPIGCYAALCAAAALAGCAKTPGAIAPASIPAGMYDGASCQTAAAEYAALTEQTRDLYAAQNAAVAADAVGVFLVLVPVGSLVGGDNEGQIAEAKGRALALEARLRECGGLVEGGRS